jgi:ubiquinone/menaquinone biosynthesis C-methylase UbiE
MAEKNDMAKYVCPVSLAGGLDNRIRNWVQNPVKILEPYVEVGMTALDIGCGPGFFTVAMAGLVGKSGRVIAADLQEGMLLKLKNKIQKTEIEPRITLHKCNTDSIDISEKVDFVFAFYMVHEVPDQVRFFKEIASILKPSGKFLMVEPKFHVSKNEFETTVNNAGTAGFAAAEGPKVLFSRAAIFHKGRDSKS